MVQKDMIPKVFLIEVDLMLFYLEFFQSKFEQLQACHRMTSSSSKLPISLQLHNEY